MAWVLRPVRDARSLVKGARSPARNTAVSRPSAEVVFSGGGFGPDALRKHGLQRMCHFQWLARGGDGFSRLDRSISQQAQRQLFEGNAHAALAVTQVDIQLPEFRSPRAPGVGLT